VFLSSMMMKYLNHRDDDPNLTVKVIDIDAPGTGRIPRTLIRPYNELQPESKRAFERGFEELKHRTNMKTGGITAFDKRDFGLDLRFTHRKEQFLPVDDQSNVLEVLDVFIDYTVQIALFEMPSTGKYRKPSSAGPTCIAIPGMWIPETAGEGAPEGDVFDEEKARRDATNNFSLAWLKLAEAGRVNRLAAARMHQERTSVGDS
jgi:hypothetical protein